MTQKTEITESEWLSLLAGETNRSLKPPAGGKTIEELASILSVSTSHASRIVRDRVRRGELLPTKVGKRFYYTMVNGKAKSKC